MERVKTDNKEYDMDKWWIFNLLFWLRLALVGLGVLIVYVY